MNCVHTANFLAVLHGKNCSVGHYTQRIFFMLNMIVGIVDFCHYIQVLFTLTLAKGYRVSTKQNLFA